MNYTAAIKNRIHARFSRRLLEGARFPFSLVPPIFALHILLVFPVFIPNLADIHPGFGEAAYINNGRMLVEGSPTPFGYSPLAAFIYALTYFPVQASPYWLVYSCSIGRFLLFGLLWLSSYLLAKAAFASAAPLVMIGLLVASPALIHLLTHASHALFAALSGFALWQVLLFYQRNQMRHLVAASLFVALATLSRSGEGFILFFVLIMLSVWLSQSPKRVAALAAGTLPFAVIVSGYILSYSLLTGKFDLGMAEYSYFTFEQGHGLAFQSQYQGEGNFYVAGQPDARRLFGTPEENNYSIWAAIRRNPEAYLQRVPRLIKLAPSHAIDVYGGALGFVFFWLAARGVIELVRKQRYMLLVILLLWSSYLLVYVLLVFQATHFLFPYYVVFLLAAVGLAAVVSNFDSTKERYLWYVTLTGVAAVGIIIKQPVLVSTSFFLLLIVAITWMTMSQYRHVGSITAVGIILILAALLTKGSYPGAKFREFGIEADEQATLFMKENLKPGAFVGAYAPKNVWMARLHYIPMSRSAALDLSSDENFSRWIRENYLDAIYVDPLFMQCEPAIWRTVQKRIGRDFEVRFRSDSGDIMVLVVTAKDSNEHLGRYMERPWFSSKPRFLPALTQPPSSNENYL